jgi:hypothetical protein
VHSCNYGYIRTSGRKRYRKGQQITGCDTLNEVTEDLYLVLIIDEGKNLDAYINAARHILELDKNVSILEIDVNKEAIQTSEGIPPSLNKIARISFQYVYEEVGKCEEDLCEYVADAECDIEPCDSKTFCERVQECLPEGQPVFTEGCILGDGTESNPIRFDEACLPEPVSTDCTLEFGGGGGSGCCDYRVENIVLCPTVYLEVEFLEPYTPFVSFVGENQVAITGGIIAYKDNVAEGIVFESVGSIGLSDFVNNISTYENILITNDQNKIRIENINCAYDHLAFGIGSDATQTGSVSPSFNLLSVNSNYPVNIIQNSNNPPDAGFLVMVDIPHYGFQININGVWTDVTDEVVDGVWQRNNVCDDVITDWRILDGQNNILDSGQVTADCDGGGETQQITKTFCEWIADHEGRIRDLEEAIGNTFDCNDLEDCENFQAVQQLAQSAVQPSDLHPVATSGNYNSLNNLPTIPTNVSQLTNDSGYQTAAQVNAAIAAYKPVVVVGIDATPNQLTGNVTNGKLGSVLIPANTMPLHTIVEIEAFLRKVSASAAPNQRLWINTANNLTGATQIAILQGVTTSLMTKMERSFIVTSSGLTIFPATASAAIDDTSANGPPTDIAINWAVDQYIIHTANNAAGETTTNIFLFVKASKP